MVISLEIAERREERSHEVTHTPQQRRSRGGGGDVASRRARAGDIAQWSPERERMGSYLEICQRSYNRYPERSKNFCVQACTWKR